MNEHIAQRESEWRAALAELVEYYEACESQIVMERDHLRRELDHVLVAHSERTAERDAAHARIIELEERVAELSQPVRHVFRAVGRRLRRR